jgi:hypothetical protein
MPDLIADFCERMLAKDPNISIRMADELRYELRLEYGGRRARIPKAPAETTELGLRLGRIDPRAVPGRTLRRYR